jgi:hypothetical protein
MDTFVKLSAGQVKIINSLLNKELKQINHEADMFGPDERAQEPKISPAPNLNQELDAEATSVVRRFNELSDRVPPDCINGQLQLARISARGEAFRDMRSWVLNYVSSFDTITINNTIYKRDDTV